MHIKLKNGSKISVSKNSARAIESYFRRKGLLADEGATPAAPRKQSAPPVAVAQPDAAETTPPAAAKKAARRVKKTA